MPAATPTPGRLPAPGVEDPWLTEDPEPPWWVAGDEEPPPLCLPEDPGPDDPERIAAWLDRELAKAPWLADDPWLAEDVERGDPGWDGPAPAAPPGSSRPVEVLKAGRWDRSRGDGAGSPLVAWPITCRPGRCWRGWPPTGGKRGWAGSATMS